MWSRSARSRYKWTLLALPKKHLASSYKTQPRIFLDTVEITGIQTHYGSSTSNPIYIDLNFLFIYYTYCCPRLLLHIHSQGHQKKIIEDSLLFSASSISAFEAPPPCIGVQEKYIIRIKNQNNYVKHHKLSPFRHNITHSCWSFWSFSFSSSSILVRILTLYISLKNCHQGTFWWNLRIKSIIN